MNCARSLIYDKRWKVFDAFRFGPGIPSAIIPLKTSLFLGLSIPLKVLFISFNPVLKQVAICSGLRGGMEGA